MPIPPRLLLFASRVLLGSVLWPGLHAKAQSLERDGAEGSTPGVVEREAPPSTHGAEAERVAAEAPSPDPGTAQPTSHDLSPQAAARTLALSDQTAPESGPPNEEQLAERTPGLVRAKGASVREKLEHGSNELMWRVLRPWDQSLPLKNVRYWFTGHTFDAVILHDGSVKFRAKQGVTLSPMSTQKVDEFNEKQARLGAAANPAVGASSDNASAGQGSRRRTDHRGWGVGFGLGIAQPGRGLERFMTGKEPPNAEARDFLEKTRALREWLFAEQAAKDMTRAEEALSTMLSRLWNGPASARDRQEQTFALWDECAEDEQGEKGRAHLEAFVRKLQEVRGACPFEAEVIARLNEKRRSRRAFAPCEPPKGAR